MEISDDGEFSHSWSDRGSHSNGKCSSEKMWPEWKECGIRHHKDECIACLNACKIKNRW